MVENPKEYCHFVNVGNGRSGPMLRLGSESDEIDEAAAQRIDETLGLTERFIDAVFDDPSLLDTIPNGASLVFVPSDDEALARANTRAADKMRQAGTEVALIQV